MLFQPSKGEEGELWDFGSELVKRFQDELALERRVTVTAKAWAFL